MNGLLHELEVCKNGWVVFYDHITDVSISTVEKTVIIHFYECDSHKRNHVMFELNESSYFYLR